MAAGMKVLGITEDLKDSSDLFVAIPPTDDCVVCLVALPIRESHQAYWPCCGNSICTSCEDRSIIAQKKSNAERAMKGQPPVPQSCAFCRASKEVTVDKYLARFDKRIEMGDCKAMVALAGDYQTGTEFFEKDEQKAFQLTLRAVKLGYPKAFNKLSTFYNRQMILRFDHVKFVLCLGAAALGGYHVAHLNLGHVAYQNGDFQIALRHFQFAASTGYKPAIDKIQQMHDKEIISDAEFTAALREYQVAFMAQRSDERVKWEEKKKKEEGMSKHAK